MEFMSRHASFSNGPWILSQISESQAESLLVRVLFQAVQYAEALWDTVLTLTTLR